MSRVNDSGSFHFTACQDDNLTPERERDSGLWPPQLMSGETVNKFLIVFRLHFFENRYIFAVTSFAPEALCARISARIRVFQTISGRGSDIQRDITSTNPELRRAAAIANYDKTRLLPRIDWLGNVFPAHLEITELAKQSGCLVLPAAVVHRLRDLHPGDRLCEVLVDLKIFKKDLTQQDLCVVEDRSEVILPADPLEVTLHPVVSRIKPRSDPRYLLQDGVSESDPQTQEYSDAIIQEDSYMMGMGTGMYFDIS
jgi:hypothetical protein